MPAHKRFDIRTFALGWLGCLTGLFLNWVTGSDIDPWLLAMSAGALGIILLLFRWYRRTVHGQR